MLNILNAGVSLIQDGIGREKGFSHGIPLSGAFDKVRLAQANHLVGNALTAPAIEHHSGKLEFFAESPILVSVVSTGKVKIQADGITQFLMHTFEVPAYAFVLVETTSETSGITYIGISGLNPGTTLGSASYDTFSKIGTPPLKKGDTFNLIENEINFNNPILLETSQETRTYRLPYLKGPHYDALNPISKTLKLSVESASRSGVRFTSKENYFKGIDQIDEIRSLPVFPGVIQIPKNGNPIILGPDSGVTGGYPVLGTIPKNFLHLLARLPYNSEILLVETVSSDIKRNLNLNLGYL